MSPLPSQDELLRRKEVENAEIRRAHERAENERQGLQAALDRYWALLGEFIERARGLGLEPGTHLPPEHSGSSSRIEWVEGYRLRSGSIVTAPPSRYAVKERRRVARSRTSIFDVEEVSLFVVSTEPGLAQGLSDPKTRSGEGWPPVTRWDRAANLLLAVEAELEASLLELMGSAEQ
jgi:hypothetical protein